MRDLINNRRERVHAISRAVFFCFAFSTIFSIIADAQWKRVADAQGDFNEVYFLKLSGPPRIGFWGNGGVIQKTADGGFTWKNCGGVASYYAWSFTFKDSLNGWAESREGGRPTGGHELYRTTDGGDNWSLMTTLVLEAYDFMYDKKTGAMFITGDYPLVSWDEGQTWSLYLPAAPFSSFAFWNDDTGVVVGGISGNWERTLDGGFTWREIAADSNGGRPLAIPNTTTGFACTDYGTILRTVDLWNTWNVLFQFPPQPHLGPAYAEEASEACALVCGDLNNLYVQLSSGCYRSTDQGVTWKYLCGIPVYYAIDQRMYAKGSLVFLPTWDTITGFAHVWRLNVDSMQYFSTSIAFPDGSKRTSVSAGSEVTVNYFPQTTDPIGIDTGHLVFHYDSNSLTLKALKLPPSWKIIDSSTKNGVFGLTITADSNVAITNPMVSFTFNTYLSSPSAKVYLDSAHLYGKRLNCDCQALSLAAPDSVEINFTGCGDSLLLAAMQHAPPFRIESIVPNPASTAIEITLSTSSAPISYSLFDALGRTVLSNETSAPEWTLDVSNVPSGLYFLRLSENGFTKTRRVVIER